METLESLADALETTGEIQSIVRTMKALSSVSIRQYERAEEAMADYARTVELGLIALLRQRRDAGLDLFASDGPETDRAALLVMGSDRGLCGRYNDVVARVALSHLQDGDRTLGVVGARIAARLEAEGRQPDALFLLPGSVDGLTRLVQTVILEIDRWTRERGVERVTLVHNRREGRVAASPQIRRLLPLPIADLRALSAATWSGRSRPCFRMRTDTLTSWLVQQRLFVTIYRALTEALASEHASRLAAMQAAEKNIQERRDDLRQRHRRRRQDTITRELLDMVTGYEAARDSR